MTMMLRNRVVVITGGTSGIGLATALRFAKKGATLVLVARGRDGLSRAAGACRAEGAEVLAIAGDVTSLAEMEAVADTAVEQFGRLDVWVNCASVSVYSAFLNTPIDDFRRVIEVNQLGYVNGARAALVHMTGSGSGTLINVASVVGEVPQPFAASYAMSKAAIRALGVSLRQELALRKAKRIHVVTVSPPTMDTPFFSHAANYTGRQVVAMPPVYPAERVAKAIVSVAATRSPAAEIVVGRIGRALARQHRLMPKTTEAVMAVQTTKGQFSRRSPAEPTVGNLYSPLPPSGFTGDGWHGARRSRRRAVLRAVAVAAIAVAIGRALNPEARGR